MLMSRDEIIADIEAQIRKGGGLYSEWCVGVAEDPRELTDAGSVAGEKEALLIYREAFTPGVARAVRDYFVNECGADRDSGDKGNAGKFVYAYKKASQADQSSPTPARPFASRRWAA
jgi:hypothetical protein